MCQKYYLHNNGGVIIRVSSSSYVVYVHTLILLLCYWC